MFFTQQQSHSDALLMFYVSKNKLTTKLQVHIKPTCELCSLFFRNIPNLSALIDCETSPCANMIVAIMIGQLKTNIAQDKHCSHMQ